MAFGQDSSEKEFCEKGIMKNNKIKIMRIL